MGSRSRSASTFIAVVFLMAARASAQDPSGPPPPPGDRGTAGPNYHELLPDIGLIGSQVGLAFGPSWNPFEVGRGTQASGFIDIPLSRAPGGKLSYQLVVGLSAARSDPFLVTDSVAYIANLASGASPSAALQGPPGAPFPVRREVRTRLRLLQVSPFGLKYTLRRLEHRRIRPYAAAGIDFIVVITRQDPVADESLDFRGSAPFDAPLIGGLIGQAPELAARNYPTGAGNIDLGVHASSGIELRLFRRASANLDYRYSAVGAGERLHNLALAVGFHW